MPRQVLLKEQKSLRKEEISAEETLQGLPQDIKESLIQHTISLTKNAIIPLLESDTSNFEMKFDEAVRYFSRYMVQLISLINSIQTTKEPNISDKVNKSSLWALSNLKNKFLQIDNEPVASILVNAISTLEDYILLANDPEIDVNKPKYNPLIEAYFNIWICITALSGILSIKDIIKDYNNNQTDLLIEKCQDSTKMLQHYVMKLAADYGRELSPMVTKVLDDIDSGKAKITRYKNVDDYLKHLDEISSS